MFAALVFARNLLGPIPSRTRRARVRTATILAIQNLFFSVVFPQFSMDLQGPSSD